MAEYNEVIEELKYSALFSEYLPSNFSLESESTDIFEIELSNKNDFVEPLKFTMSRFSNDNQRRVIYIPELTSYIRLIKFMEEKSVFEEIMEFSQRNENSYSKVVQSDGTLLKHESNYGQTSVDLNDEPSKSTYIKNVVNKINRAKGAKGILYIDIANFYGSIYTHITPAIVLGYDLSLEQYKLYMSNLSCEEITPEYKNYRELDKKLRALNGGRTNGLLTGPTISFLVAEALLTRIDKELKDQGLDFVRYMDDYEIFIYEEQSIEKIKNLVIKVFSKYFLSINNEKTEYRKYPYFKMKNLEEIYINYTEKELESADIIEIL